MRILSGIQPTGTPHLGNYFAMMKPAIELQEQGEAFLFIADYHAITTTPDPNELRQRVANVAIDFLACGLDPSRTVFYRQSDVPQVTELAWVLNCVTPMGLLERCHSYKDKVAHGKPANNGLFSYPVLMASDILFCKSNTVPVGKDQKQHVEVARDIAQRFNNQYGEVFVLPEPSIRGDVAVVPGTDGQKMSKSYGNTIELFGEEKKLRKKFMSILTDSKPVEEPKEPEGCPVFELYKLFASPSQRDEMAERFRKGGMAYGVAKQELFEMFWAHFAPLRESRARIASDPGYVESVLKAGAEKARGVAEATMNEVRHAVGLR